MRNTLLITLLASAVVGPGSTTCAQAPSAVVSTLSPREGHVFQDSVLQDVNRDGMDDLVLLEFAIQAPHTRRVVIHLRSNDRVTFRGTPDRVVNLTADVSAFALIDLGAQYGRDVILLNRTGVWLRREDGDRSKRVSRLLDVNFLWQLPDDDEAVYWGAGVRDLNGDGLEDLVIPEPGGWRVAFQSRKPDGAPSFEGQLIPVPQDPAEMGVGPKGGVALEGRTRRKTLELRVRGGGANAEVLPLVSVTEFVPAPQLADWDGDKDLDLIARTASMLHVWVQGTGGFPTEPSFSFPIPVVVDRERQLDISYSAHITDLNGDARADCVFVAGNRRAKDVRTQVLVYLQGSKGRGRAATTAESPLFGPAGIPAQLLQLAGFAGFPQLDDINGDGRPDISILTFRPDLIDAMRAQTAKSLDIGWSIFVNRNGTFARRADVQSTLTLSARDLDAARDLVLTRFFPDVDGDGLNEILVQDAPRRVRLLGLRRKGRALERAGKPVWEFTWGFEATVDPGPVSRGRAEIVIRGQLKVIHVRFGS